MKIRNILSTNTLSYVAGSHDALSGKIAEEIGFDAIWASGLGISATQAVPDMSILTMSEFLTASESIASAVNIPVICDCDAGFGNMHNVSRLVEKYEKAGIESICIEDKKHPKLNSFLEGEQLCESIEEFRGKIYIACQTRKNKDFAVIARCESLIAGLGMEEALYRSNAYADAGADAILIHSKQKTPEEILEFSKRWSGKAPLVIVPTTYPSLKIDDSLTSIGISTIIFANQSLRASVNSMKEVLEEIYNDKNTQSVESRISSVKDIFNLQGIEEVKTLEEKIFEERKYNK